MWKMGDGDKGEAVDDLGGFEEVVVERGIDDGV